MRRVSTFCCAHQFCFYLVNWTFFLDFGMSLGKSIVLEMTAMSDQSSLMAAVITFSSLLQHSLFMAGIRQHKAINIGRPINVEVKTYAVVFHLSDGFSVVDVGRVSKI